MIPTQKPEKVIRQSCNTINKLFEQPNFFQRLCTLSNNNIDKVINNIYLIINYYLSTNDVIYSYSIQDILLLASNTKEVQDIVIHPSNSYYEKRYKIFGLNYISTMEDPNAIELETIEYQVSYHPCIPYDYLTEITTNIKEAIITSFTSPKIIYKSILKQPTSKELPIVSGTRETNYYQSILEIRLKNVDEEYRKTATKKAKRILKNYIGKDALLVVFPRLTKKYYISNHDISTNSTIELIPSKYLSFIRIPSRYKLISICNQNKQTRAGELIDINTGEDYHKEETKKELDYHLYYSRYELIDVTDEFEYTNQEFTQDINYDIDLIYGYLDTNNTKKRISKNPYTNISFIKSKEDIHVRKINGKYHIRNGRHRLLFLKHFYVSNYDSYKEMHQLDRLKDFVKVPASVERTIELPSINNLLDKIKELNPKTTIFKTNINNEDPELIIIIEDNVYITKDESTLEDLYNELSIGNLINKYYIGKNSNQYKINYEELFDYLIITLKEKLYTMSLTDIINYLIKEGFYQKDQYFLISNLNYIYLYFEYTDFQHYLQLRRVLNKEITIIEDTEDKVIKKEIGFKIMSLIEENIDLMYLDWNDLYQVLIKYEEFKSYDSAFLESAANIAGYQKYKILQLYGNESYAKRLFL